MFISNEIDGLIKESQFRLDSVSSTQLKKRVLLKIDSVNYTYQNFFISIINLFNSTSTKAGIKPN